MIFKIYIGAFLFSENSWFSCNFKKGLGKHPPFINNMTGSYHCRLFRNRVMSEIWNKFHSISGWPK